METLPEVRHPSDPQYKANRRRAVRDLMKLSIPELREMVNYNADAPVAPAENDTAFSRKILGDMRGSQYVPDSVKGILDSTGGTTGNVLIRQDLEAPMYALFVKQFPLFEYLQRGPANGLVHAATQITSPENGYSLGNSIITELGTVSYVASQFVRQTYPIAVFATGRGVGLKELAAVTAGGANYDPMGTEMANGMVRLAQDVQYQLFQGNFTNGAGTAANEGGLQNTNGFDGLRGVLGSFGSFSANNAVQVDQGASNLTESLQLLAARLANAGGMPSAVVMSIGAKQALDIEQQGNRRYNDGPSVVPGLVVDTLAWANGNLNILPVPGNTLGTYNRTSDGALVEDVYMLDENTVKMRYLWNDSFNVLEIPTGVDGVLSRRYIIFGMYGLELAAPVFCGKVRRLA